MEGVLVPNHENALVNQVDDMDRLRRFLCLGSENVTYYSTNDDVGTEDLDIQNVECIKRLLVAGRGWEMVRVIRSFSVAGRTVRQESTLFALALIVRWGDDNIQRLAYASIDQVCRIPTHLFQFVDLCEKFGRELNNGSGTGWGRAHRRAICNWYQKFGDEPLKLARLMTKYRKRHGWSNIDVLRLAHVNPDSIAVKVVLRYIFKGLAEATQVCSILENLPVDIIATLKFLEAVDDVKSFDNNPDYVQRVCQAIKTHDLAREHVPTLLHNSTEVWKALLINMPFTAMIRNLGKMASMGMLVARSEATDLVLKILRNEEKLQRAHIHPFNVLVAMCTYQQGHGQVGKLDWHPNPDITSALDDAFYMSIRYAEPTGKRFLIAIDVSSSMTSPVTGCNMLNALQAAAALSMVTAGREQHCQIVGFSDTLVPININPDMKLTDVIAAFADIDVGNTDCAAPILWAMKEKRHFDVFIICTDSETQSGHVPPAHALREYRQRTGIHRAKLIVCAFTSNGFTVADPQDRDMLDMAGFDSNGPAVINTFITEM